MEQARPLRDVFADLATSDDARRQRAADPDGFLDEHGHGELPDGLVSEAIVNYADVAPVEVAAHLAPFVQAHSAIPADGPVADGPVADAGAAGLDAMAGLDLLASAPTEPVVDELTVDEPAVDQPAGDDADRDDAPVEVETDLDGNLDGDLGSDLDSDLAGDLGSERDTDLGSELGGDFDTDLGAGAGDRSAAAAADPFDLDFGGGDRTEIGGGAGTEPAEVAEIVGGARLPDGEPAAEPAELAGEAGPADLPGADLVEADELPTDGEPTIDE